MVSTGEEEGVMGDMAAMDEEDMIVMVDRSEVEVSHCDDNLFFQYITTKHSTIEHT